MNRRRCFSIAMMLLLTACPVSAQDESPRQIFEQAEEAYQIGKIEEAKHMVESCVLNLSSSHRLAGYRLLSLCCLALDQMDEARHYAEKVLQENPYYIPTVEYPPRFIDMINEIKQGITTTITTASSQNESVNEAPVPITIITAEMIEELGYNKNLNQILAAYVPGMTEVATYEPGDNLAMHGAFANNQELILIMENGHRMNSRYNNLGTTSYSISTEKIDHIEVLRGPASSLYGNVALSAVVNIITKSGRDIDGVKGHYGYGSYNTHRADLLVGTQFMDADISAWASIYNSNGQIRHLDDSEGYYSDIKDHVEMIDQARFTYFGPDRIYVDSYKDTPSYDLGFTFRLKGFNLMFSHKNVKKLYQITYWSGYDYDRYPAINGIKPGVSHEETHTELGYSRQLGRFSLNASLYSDWYTMSNYRVDYDSLEGYDYAYDEQGNFRYDEEGHEIFVMKSDSGSIYFNNCKENTIGGILKIGTDYSLGNMKGNLLAGCHFEHFSIQSRLSFYGNRYETIDNGSFYYHDLITKGKEENLSLFLQDKHYFTPQLILNTGMRYDLIYHKDGHLTAFSPRLALMYVPSDLFSLKLSYAQAFADLAYYYRYVFDGIFELKPQYLSAIQLTAMGIITPLNLNYEVNFFYNSYRNLLFWSARLDDNLDFHQALNNGHLKNAGIEASVRYASQRFSGNLNLYYCHDISSENYYYNSIEKMVTEVPHLTLNLHGAYKLFQTVNHELKLYGHVSYTGRKLNQTYYEKEDYYVKAQTLFDLGMKYTYHQRLMLSIDCENLLNTDRYLCGPIVDKQHPIFQHGRTLMASISYHF